LKLGINRDSGGGFRGHGFILTMLTLYTKINNVSYWCSLLQ
jgi:hypothetical protein